jgi:Putative secretion activating protein
MAKVELLAPILFKWEGKWSDDASDKGGKTNMGITLSTWKACGYDKDGDHDIDSDDLRLITKEDVVNLLRKYYWNRWQADLIKNQSIANILVDWVWNSGAWGIKIPQELLDLKVDGLVGAKTISAINAANPELLFAKIWNAREKFFQNLAKNDPSQAKFLKGWLNRLDDFKYSEQ